MDSEYILLRAQEITKKLGGKYHKFYDEESGIIFTWSADDDKYIYDIDDNRDHIKIGDEL